MSVYAVLKGRKTGLFYTWDACSKSVQGFKGAEFKKFKCEDDAREYLSAGRFEEVILLSEFKKRSEFCDKAVPYPKSRVSIDDVMVGVSDLDSNDYNLGEDEGVLFTDGSYTNDGVYGFGIVLVTSNKVHTLCGCDNNIKLSSSRNVAGELCGVLAGLRLVEDIGITKLTIVHDYYGVSAFATGSWSAKSDISKAYKTVMDSRRGLVDFKFNHVEGHSGVYYNEYADRLARKGIRDKIFVPTIDLFRVSGCKDSI